MLCNTRGRIEQSTYTDMQGEYNEERGGRGQGMAAGTPENITQDDGSKSQSNSNLGNGWKG